MLRFFLWVFPAVLFAQQQWVDSVYASMSLDQKIGQLFMVMAYPDGNSQKQNYTRYQILNQHVGGLLFSKGTSFHQQRDTQYYQDLSSTPLLMAADAEWGMAMRLNDVEPYPYAMTLGAVPNEELIYAMAKRIGARMRAFGVHVSFAPVADVNTEPKNPIIGFRAFGDNPNRIARQTQAFAEGLQDANMIAVAKHFPGHGAAKLDSHKSLPRIEHTRNQLNRIDLIPFKKLINSAVKGIMVGHLEIPALENNNIPVSTSIKVVTHLLQQQMGFKGLIFTDALDMKGITKKVESPALAAFLAGADILVMPENLTKAIAEIKTNYIEGKISSKRLAHSVKKILTAKFALGLHQDGRLISASNALQINNTDTYLKQQIALQSVVNVYAKPNELPIKPSGLVAYMVLGKPTDNTFLSSLRTFAEKVEVFSADAEKPIRGKKIVIGVFANTASPWSKQSITPKEIELLQRLASQNNVHVVVFANSYLLAQVPDFKQFSSVLLAHENQPEFAKAAAQILFGKRLAVGVLPVNIVNKP